MTSEDAARAWSEAQASIADRELCPLYDGYELAPGVAETFLHPAEASLVAQICALGHPFRALEDFVARVKGDLLLHPLDGALGGVAGGGADEPDEAAPPRIYLRAVAMAVDVVLLKLFDPNARSGRTPGRRRVSFGLGCAAIPR